MLLRHFLMPKEVPRGTLEVALSSKPISLLQKPEEEHRGGPWDSHGLVGSGAHAFCRTTGGDDGRERQYGVFFFFPFLLGCFQTPARRRLRYALTTRLVVGTRLLDNLIESSVRLTVVKLSRAGCKVGAPLGMGAASAAGSVAYRCRGLNMF